MKVAVLGGGHGCYAAAAELSEVGHEIWFWRRDADAFAPVLQHGTIEVRDRRRTRRVHVAHPTLSLDAALAAAELIVIPLPATAQESMASAVAPHLRDGQVVFLPPGTLGSLIFARAAQAIGNHADVAYAETGTLPYLARKHGADAVTVSGYATRLPTGIFPGRLSGHGLDVVGRAYPAIEPLPDLLSAALMNAGPIIHPPLILMNAGPLEHFPAWDIHNEGTQPAIRRVTTALDAERIAVRAALGYGAPHFPLADHYALDGDEWMYGRGAHQQLTDSADWREKITLTSHRYMREDVALGLALIVSLGRWAGCATPVAAGLLSVASAVLGEDLDTTGRTIDRLGLAALDRAGMAALLHDGFPE